MRKSDNIQVICGPDNKSVHPCITNQLRLMKMLPILCFLAQEKKRGFVIPPDTLMRLLCVQNRDTEAAEQQKNNTYKVKGTQLQALPIRSLNQIKTNHAASPKNTTRIHTNSELKAASP